MTETLAWSRVGVSRTHRALAGYAFRLTRGPILVAGVIASWLLVWWRADDVNSTVDAIWLLRSASALVAVTVVFALDDPSIDSTRSLPAGRGVLMRLRFGTVGAVALIALAPASVESWGYISTRLTVVGLVIEVLVLVVLTATVTLVLQRQFGISEPAQFVVLALIGLLMLAQLLAQRWPLLALPGPQWVEAHWRWVMVLAVGLLTLSWQLRDPAARAPWRKRR